jgi:hypothetical protein
MADSSEGEKRRVSPSWWERSWVAIGGLVLVVWFGYFWPATLGSRFLIIHDSWCWSYPLRGVAWRSLKSGEIPLWSSGLFSGYPLLSMSQLSLAYPLTWVYPIDAAWGEQLYVLAPFIVSPLFVYAYVRSLGRTRPAALLSGLGFAYGGYMASPISHNGMLSNGFMWAPVVLLAVERARTGAFVPSLLLGAVGYGMAVLSGIGQGFLSAGIVVLAYGAFVSLRPSRPLALLSHDRLRPALVAGGSVALGAGLAAFQVLETMGANRLSVRNELSYTTFIEGSPTVGSVFVSIVDPLHRTIGDVTAFVAPLVLVLAVLAVVSGARKWRASDGILWFWFGTAIIALFLMFGGATPFYRVVYRLPLLNLFRVPPRHAAEWTLAVAVLGSYGWDLAADKLRAAFGQSASRARLGLAAGLITAGVVVTFLWNAIPGTSEAVRYLVLKLVASLLLFAAAAAACILSHERARALLLGATIVLGTVSESYICISRWWFPASKSRADLERVAPITAQLQRLPAAEHRIYSHINPFGEESVVDRPADTPNATALLGLHETAGYDPMIFRRYSEALGNAGMFATPVGWNRPPDAGYSGPFNARSHVLDILNVTHVVRRLLPGEPITPPEWEQSRVLDRLVVDVGAPRSRASLESGFSGDEEIGGHSGAWTDGRQSVVKAFLMPADARYELRLVALAYRAASPLTITVRVNGKRVGTIRVKLDWREVTLKLPRDALVEGWNEVVLAYSRTVTPASIDPTSGDRRQLAMFLDFLALTPAE